MLFHFSPKGLFSHFFFFFYDKNAEFSIIPTLALIIIPRGIVLLFFVRKDYTEIGLRLEKHPSEKQAKNAEEREGERTTNIKEFVSGISLGFSLLSLVDSTDSHNYMQ